MPSFARGRRGEGGTGAAGGLTPAGRDLVKEMDRLGIVLDVTHLTDEAFWEALNLYKGHVWASHNNCRALVPADRQFSIGLSTPGIADKSTRPRTSRIPDRMEA